MIEGAKKEGKLVWYTSMAIDTSKPLLDAFQKEYPFIKSELVRAGEEQLMTRVLGEIRAGRWAVDSFFTLPPSAPLGVYALEVVVEPSHGQSQKLTRSFVVSDEFYLSGQ